MKVTLGRILYKATREYLRVIAPRYPSCVRIRSPRETLQRVSDLIASRTPGAYLRFGDGEVTLLYRIEADEQSGHAGLALELREAMELGGDGIVKSLMIHSRRFGRSDGMANGFHMTTDECATNVLNLCFQYFIGEPIYSPTALAYALVKERDMAISFFRLLKGVGGIVFVGRENIDAGLLHSLFGEDCVHIKTPPRDAFAHVDEIDRTIQAELARRAGFTVVVVAAGPCAKVLQKRLYLAGRNAFTCDIGSVMDALSEVGDTRAWISLAGVPMDYCKRFISEI